MLIPEILQQLERITGWLPKRALEAATAQREEITPALIEILEKTAADAEEVAGQEDYMAHLYALLLLGQFREKRAQPVVEKLLTLPDDVLEDLCGDFAADDLPRVLASVCGGETESIKALALNAEADPIGRSAALDTLVILAVNGMAKREDVASFLGELYRGGLERKMSPVWDMLASCTVELGATDLTDELTKAFEEKLIDPEVFSLKDAKAEMSRDPEVILRVLRANPHFTLIGEVAREMSGWACFRDVRAGAEKVGRNDPCPCGSGKKYKKCCLG